MARHFANDARDPDRAVILIDPKGPLAELCLGLVAGAAGRCTTWTSAAPRSASTR